MKLRALTPMPYRIESIVYAVGQRLIADIDGIAARSLEVWLVGGQ